MTTYEKIKQEYIDTLFDAFSIAAILTNTNKEVNGLVEVHKNSEAAITKRAYSSKSPLKLVIKCNSHHDYGMV